MRKLKAIQIAAVMVLVVASTILFTNCQKESSPVESSQTSLPKFSLPAGATFVSATFNVKINVATNQQIDIHRITSPWEEMVVTWNNFGGSFAPEIVNSFMASAVGWTSVDITSLVGGWLNGTYPNYGLLLDQVNQTWPRTEYDTREYEFSVNASYLEICYTLNGSAVCDTTRNIGDTYIYQLNPDENNGFKGEMYTGWGYYNDLEKQALVQFDLGFTPPPPPEECETAYAYGGGDVFAQCFIGLPGVQANNWGWSNHITDVSTNFSYEWPIYAGAAGCSGGTLVGTLYVDYNASTDCVTFDYDINPPYTFDAFHLWVSEESLLPIKRNGNYITSPGQFNHNGETEVCNLDGPFWIAAHFGVCH